MDLCIFESYSHYVIKNLIPDHGEVYLIQHYVINLAVTCGMSVVSGTPVSSANKTELHDITEILLKVVLNIIKKPEMLSLKQ